MVDHIAAARHIGGDDRTFHGGGLDQSARKTFPPRGEHHDVAGGIDQLHVLNMAEAADALIGTQLSQFSRGQCRAVTAIECTGHQQLQFDAICPQTPAGLQQLCNSLFSFIWREYSKFNRIAGLKIDALFTPCFITAFLLS